MTMEQLAEALRISLGLAPEDLPWIEVTSAGALAAMRNYTKRWLFPIANFKNILEHGETCCRGGRYPRYNEVALSEFPIVSVQEVRWDKNLVAPASLEFFPSAGYLRIENMSGFQRLDVLFQAGFTDFPMDLFLAMTDILKNLRAVDTSGGGSGISVPKRISIVDVGAVDLSGGLSSAYVDAALAKAIDPLLGPWIITLDPYVDHVKNFWSTSPRYSEMLSVV